MSHNETENLSLQKRIENLERHANNLEFAYEKLINQNLSLQNENQKLTIQIGNLLQLVISKQVRNDAHLSQIKAELERTQWEIEHLALATAKTFTN